MVRGGLIAVIALLAAVGPPGGVARAQQNPPTFAPPAGRPVAGRGPVVPVLPVEPAAPLPPVPNFDPLRDAGTAWTAFQPGSGSTPAEEPPATVPPGELILPDGSGVVLPEGVRQTIRFGPRYGKLNDYTVDKQPDGTQRLTYSGGLKVNVVTLPDVPGKRPEEVEFAADNVVIWVRGMKAPGDFLSSGLEVDRSPKKDGDRPEETKAEKMTVELYLSGNVVIRTLSDNAGSASQGGPGQQILRADEIYYDVDKNRCIALAADLETKYPIIPDSIHLRGREIWRLGRQEWRAYDTSLFTSKRPADPALTITSREATLLDQEVVKRNIFGRPYRNARTGQVDVSGERMLTAYRNRVRVLGVPLIPIPRFRADLSDPAGPLISVLLRRDNVYGWQFYNTFDAYKLLALRAPPDHAWRLNLDYLSFRGPAGGTTYQYRNAFFGPEYGNAGSFNLYLLHDKGADLLGGFRGLEPNSSLESDRTRGWLSWSHGQSVYEDGTTYARANGQFAFLSDKNFYEQFYKQQFDTGLNQETFAQLYGATGNVTWSALGQANVNRPWVTETNWLPRGDVGLTGQTFFNDLFVYSARGTAGYAQFKPASQDPLSTLPSEARAVDTGLFNVNQRVGVPFDAGPFRIEPYGTADLSYYTQNLNGTDQGRAYGGGGVRASVPLSKVYSDVSSELLNVRGIHHKVTAGANYFAGYASADRRDFPLLNRLNDDTVDLSYRTWRPLAYGYTPGPAGLALTNSPLYDPQTLATRRLLDNRPETLDTLQVLQLDLRQRWQTKRGRPGADHTVDWMSLDLSASVFPNPARDNFGQVLGFLEYNYVWNVGDRTALSSSGWVDPITNGAKYLNFGAWYNRPDGSNLYLGYRVTDPLNSRVFIASIGYQLSTKYNVSLMNAFDFGTNLAQSTQVTFNRTGTDVTMSFGFSFSALVPGNNVGFQFLILPNAAVAATPGGRAIGPLGFNGAAR